MEKEFTNQEMNKLFREEYQGIDIEKVARQKLSTYSGEKRERLEAMLNHDLKIIKEKNLEAYVKLQYLIKMQSKSCNEVAMVENIRVKEESAISLLLEIKKHIPIPHDTAEYKKDFNWCHSGSSISIEALNGFTTVETTCENFVPLAEYVNNLFKKTKSKNLSELEKEATIIVLDENDNGLLKIIIKKQEILNMLRRFL